jgi:abortive infection bacteriophage resistance protein
VPSLTDVHGDVIYWSQQFPPRLECSHFLKSAGHFVSRHVRSSRFRRPDRDHRPLSFGVELHLESISQSDHRRAGLEHALRTHGLPLGPDRVQSAHAFDSELRGALGATLASIELALRGRVDVVMERAHGASWLDQSDAFRTETDLQALRTRVRRELDRTVGTRSRYRPGDGPVETDFGRIAEELSFGTLSHVCGALRPEVQRTLARSFAIPPPTLRSTLQHLSHVRNLCAHHVRLVGRTIQCPTPRYRNPELLAAAVRLAAERRAFSSVVIAAHVAAGVPETERVRRRLHDALELHRSLLPTIGCPADWQALLQL